MTYHRINRNIVECKLIFISNLGNDSDGINRNIVECKYRHYFSTVTRDAELIETLWNVNDISVIKLVTSRRINRNIVECKSKYCSDSFCKQIELIETLWNVNKFTNVKFDSNS